MQPACRLHASVVGTRHKFTISCSCPADHHLCQFASKSVHIYRATRMHSADYAVARCLSVCLSVRLSHAGIEFKRLYISSKFFSPSGSPTILVFPYQTGCQYSDGDLLMGASKNGRGYEKITIFDQYRALSRK